MNDFEQFYDGREQTLVKHSVLKRYLQRFAYIIGSRWNSITYIDCFSGPWNERSSTFSDTSFAIAIEQLRTARQQLANDFRIRCFFIERDPIAYSKLKEFTESIDDIEIQTHNARFEDSIGEIIRFVHADKRTFPFFLIDPKGWSIPLETIAPHPYANASIGRNFCKRARGHSQKANCKKSREEGVRNLQKGSGIFCVRAN